MFAVPDILRKKTRPLCFLGCVQTPFFNFPLARGLFYHVARERRNLFVV